VRVRSWATAWWLGAGLVLVAAGCGGKDHGDAAPADAGGDAAPVADAARDSGGIPFPEAGDYDAWMPEPNVGDAGASLFGAGPADFGPAVRVDSVVIPGPEIGLDLDGDATTDNEFGSLPVGLPELNDALATAVADGTIMLTFEMRGLDALWLTGGDAALDVAAYRVVPTATAGEFLVARSSLDAAGEARNEFFGATIAAPPPGALLAAQAPYLGTVLFGLPLLEPRLVGELVGDSVPTPQTLSELANAVVGGVYSACGMALIPDTFLGGESLLSLLLGFGVEPDIDLSGDGLETFQITPVLPADVISCTDGDGTVIPDLPGRPCACDERIEDGMSLALQIHAAAVTLVGVEP
jgi:hypothetical protein